MTLFGKQFSENEKVRFEICVRKEVLEKIGWEFFEFPEVLPHWIIFDITVRVDPEDVKGWVYYLWNESFSWQVYRNAAPMGSAKDYGVTVETLLKLSEHEFDLLSFEKDE